MQFKPIILSQDENILSYLQPELADIEITEEKGKLRTLSLTYPFLDEKIRNLFKIGNKIWIPSTSNGLKSCLFIINSDYTVDYWDKNVFTVEAEEVLTELNYVDIFTQTETETVTVNRARLEEWFGSWFNIGEVDPCMNQNLAVISTAGTMTKMSLLRFIEQETGNVFRTRYEKDENSNLIHRYLDFKQPNHVGVDFQEHVLDLGRTAENIVYEIDESDTYRGVAPILSLNSVSNTSTTENNSTMTRADLKKVINEWKSLAVTKGDVIPMIVEKKQTTEEGTNNTIEEVVYTANWAAPFHKEADDLYIVDDISTDAEYNEVRSRPDLGADEDKVTYPKIGSVSTSNTDKYAIYNDCAMKLIEKRYPEIKLSAETKDLNEIMGDTNGFNVYDKIYVKVPHFDRLLSVNVEKTVKNPNAPGENKISLSNVDLSNKITQQETYIQASDMKAKYGKGQYFTAQLLSNGEPVANKTCSITLVKPDTQQTVVSNTNTNSTSNTTTVASAEGYNQYGVSSDGTKLMAIGRPSSAADSKYAYKFYKTVFQRKCPWCGSNELYWSIFWAGNETGNWGTFPATGNRESGSAEGQIFCKKCDADFSCVTGSDHNSPPRKSLTKVSETVSSTKQEAYNLKNGKLKGGTVVSSATTQKTGESVDSIMKEASSIRYSSPSCSPACSDVDEGYQCVKSRRVADCFGMSAYLYRRLNDNGHRTRIVVYYSQYAGSGTHRTVQVYQNGTWVDPSYSGFDWRFKAMKTKKNMRVCKDAPANVAAQPSTTTSTTAAATTTTTTQSTVAGYTKIYNRKTNANGEFSVQINLPVFDNYELRCNFGGDIEYGRSSRNVKLVVEK